MEFTPAEIIKSYTKLINISELHFSKILQAINVNSKTNTLEQLSQEICSYCDEAVKQVRD